MVVVTSGGVCLCGAGCCAVDVLTACCCSCLVCNVTGALRTILFFYIASVETGMMNDDDMKMIFFST